MRIFLFDIDGVLLKPFGYRKAYFETCKWLIDKGKLKINFPGDDIPALFESYGVTCEWDMLAITAAIMLKDILEKNQFSTNAARLESALAEFTKVNQESIDIDYRRHIEAISAVFHANEIPSVGVLYSADKYLSNIPSKLCDDVLNRTRSAKNCLLTGVFQNFVLGTTLFEQTYDMKSVISCDSYLQSFDKSLITEQSKNELINQRDSGNILFAGLTARPSLQPRSVHSSGDIDYSPEAELALDVIGMPDLPLIGYGRLQYVEQLIGISADSLIKPDPFHTYAALFSVLLNSEESGLRAAAAFHGQKELSDLLREKIGTKLEIAIFEDSPGGIRSVLSAADQLNKSGIQVIPRLYGITTNKDKERALRNLGAIVFPDINAALKQEINL